jgi:hypothetical protein
MIDHINYNNDDDFELQDAFSIYCKFLKSTLIIWPSTWCQIHGELTGAYIVLYLPNRLLKMQIGCYYSQSPYFCTKLGILRTMLCVCIHISLWGYLSNSFEGKK